MQDCSISIANTLEILQFCFKPLFNNGDTAVLHKAIDMTCIPIILLGGISRGIHLCIQMIYCILMKVSWVISVHLLKIHTSLNLPYNAQSC